MRSSGIIAQIYWRIPMKEELELSSGALVCAMMALST
jgi:hypothetical protein